MEGLTYTIHGRVSALRLAKANCFRFQEKAFLSRAPMRNTHFSHSQGYFYLPDEEKVMRADREHGKEG